MNNEDNNNEDMNNEDMNNEDIDINKDINNELFDYLFIIKDKLNTQEYITLNNLTYKLMKENIILINKLNKKCKCKYKFKYPIYNNIFSNNNFCSFNNDCDNFLFMLNFCPLLINIIEKSNEVYFINQNINIQNYDTNTINFIIKLLLNYY
jgi:hypothetical protein